jgi:LysM repeat protein
MKWRHWSILIVLVLLNYIIFSTAITQLAKQRQPSLYPTRTPLPTYESAQNNPVGWVVLPTSTPWPTRTPITATPPPEITPAPVLTVTEIAAIPTVESPTEMPATVAPPVESVVHVVQAGETLSQIAESYGVAMEEVMALNGLADPNLIEIGQELYIPASGSVPPTATVAVQPTPKPTSRPPTPKPTKKPPTPTSRPPQFTAQVLWDPMVSPNCGGPGVSKQSVVRDAGGNAINGVVVEVNCYDNIMQSRPSGNPGEYDAGHYDFGFGQSEPQNWTCTARVLTLNGQPVASSQVATIQFDTNNCKPGGEGHQVAILNWTKNW